MDQIDKVPYWERWLAFSFWISNNVTDRQNRAQRLPLKTFKTKRNYVCRICPTINGKTTITNSIITKTALSSKIIQIIHHLLLYSYFRHAFFFFFVCFGVDVFSFFGSSTSFSFHFPRSVHYPFFLAFFSVWVVWWFICFHFLAAEWNVEGNMRVNERANPCGLCVSLAIKLFFCLFFSHPFTFKTFRLSIENSQRQRRLFFLFEDNRERLCIGR